VLCCPLQHNIRHRPMELTAPDADLIAAARSGNLKAFGGLVMRYEACIRACLAMRLSNPHEAEDLAQEVFLTAFRRLDTFDQNLPPGPWLRGIAFNLLRNHLRKHRPIAVGGAAELEQLIDRHMAGRYAPAQESSLMAALQHCLQKLSGPDRDLLHRRYHEETTVQDLATSAGCGTSTITMQLHRLRQALAACIRSRVATSL
jgi:RNA polymerase sigma-70 factor, ECF subfamily